MNRLLPPMGINDLDQGGGQSDPPLQDSLAERTIWGFRRVRGDWENKGGKSAS